MYFYDYNHPQGVLRVRPKVYPNLDIYLWFATFDPARHVEGMNEGLRGFGCVAVEGGIENLEAAIEEVKAAASNRNLA